MMSADKGNKVVIAVDGSKQAEEAFDWYVNFLRQTGDELYLCHAVESKSMPTRESWDTQHKELTDKAGGLKQKFADKLGSPVNWLCEVEKPGEFVVRVAGDQKADYIVIGTRGLGTVRRTIMGSVSDFVVHHASCPVLVCRQKKN